ncbi:MAG: polyprenyl synthetase family protein [Acidimicrobiales bacterium]
MSLAPLLSLPWLDEDMVRVEKALRATVSASDPFLSQVAGHLVAAGGKRLRPALAVAVGELAQSAATGRSGPDAGGPASDDVVMGAVAVELVHLGSLYHDDVMDEARTRRNVESVNSRWGNLVAILAGDFLLARASEIAASLGTEVAGLLATTIGRLCEGQVGELSTAFDLGRSEESYLRSINGKTAALMATACRVGAICAGFDREAIDALTSYGEAVGMVFQIVDDILDVVATDEELGKPAGNDLLEGVFTLPVLKSLADDPTGELHRILASPITPADVDQARMIVRSNGAVPAALDVARSFAAAASSMVRCHAGLPQGPVAHALASLGDHLIATVE